MTKFNTIWVFVLLLIVDAFITCASLDPYGTLGVSRSASQQQIKKSYKTLAREWHPDKNTDPGAGDRFIEIQQAYEILSDEEKRSQYDTYGHVDDNPHQNTNANMFRGFQFPGGRGGSFSFKFSSGGGQRSQPSRVTLRKLQAEIYPGSYSKPYLLLVTGDWCFSCMRVESHWDQIQIDLQSAGLGTGKVNAEYDYNVLRYLRIYKKPSIVAVIHEVAYRYEGNELSTEHLKKFVADLLPTNLVTRVIDNTRQEFLSQFQASNKPSVLLFTRRSTPSTLYLLLAFQFHQKINFGFVQTTDAHSRKTVDDFDVQWNQRQMLIFKEDTDNPAEEMEISNIETEELSSFLSSNQHLHAPRLSSQALYEQLCPETPYSHSKSFCVILCLKQKQELSQTHDSFIQVAMTTDAFQVKVKFVYIVEEKQSEFINKLGQPNGPEGTLPVVVLWRIDGRRAYWQWLPEGWRRDEPDADKANLASFLSTIKWTKANELPELNDEFAPNIGKRIFLSVTQKLKEWFRSVWDLFTQGSLNEVSLIMVVALIYLLCLLLMFFGLIAPPKQNESEHVDTNEARQSHTEGAIHHRDGEVRQRRSTTSRLGNKPMADRSLPITELCVSTYNDLIRDPPTKPQIILVLLLTDETKSQLFRLLKREIFHHVINYPVLSLAYVNLNSNLKWCNELLAQNRSKRELVGTVLGIRRPLKNYLNLFTSQQNIPDEDTIFDSEEDRTENSLDDLNMWLDRLLDGGLRKIDVDRWPEMVD